MPKRQRRPRQHRSIHCQNPRAPSRNRQAAKPRRAPNPSAAEPAPKADPAAEIRTLSDEPAKPEARKGPTPDAVEKAAQIKQQIAKAMAPATSSATAWTSWRPTRASRSRSPTTSISACSRSARPCRAAIWCWRWKRSARCSTPRRARSPSTAIPTGGPSRATPTTTGGCRPRAPIRPTTCWCAAASTSSRITEVAGFADRKPKIQADPFDAANRRIEILLERR